jgi:hypothetical protein
MSNLQASVYFGLASEQGIRVAANSEVRVLESFGIPGARRALLVPSRRGISGEGTEPARLIVIWRLREDSQRAPSSIGPGEHGCSKRSFRPVIDYENAPYADSDLDSSSADLGGDFVMGLADTLPFLSEGNSQTGPSETASFNEEVALPLERDGIRDRISQIVELVTPGHDRGLPGRGASKGSGPGHGGLGTPLERRMKVAWRSHVGIPVRRLKPQGLAPVTTLCSVDDQTRPGPGSDEEAVDGHRSEPESTFQPNESRSSCRQSLSLSMGPI